MKIIISLFILVNSLQLMGESAHTLKEGDHYLIPSNVPHSAHGTSSNSLALDILYSKLSISIS